MTSEAQRYQKRVSYVTAQPAIQEATCRQRRQDSNRMTHNLCTTHTMTTERHAQHTQRRQSDTQHMPDGDSMTQTYAQCTHTVQYNYKDELGLVSYNYILRTDVKAKLRTHRPSCLSTRLMARKSTNDEGQSFQVDSLDVLDKSVASANVSAVITSLSPVKKGRTRNYFEETVCDGKAKLRPVGFNLTQRTLMDDFMKSKETVDLKDCQIQAARRGHTMGV